MEGKQQWDMVDPGFKLCAPVLKRVAGRPRKSRIRPCSEGAGLGARKRKCTRCGGSGHFGKYFDNTVDPAFGESFNEGFDENVGQQSVASTDDENDGQQLVVSDEDFDEVPNDDGQQPHDLTMIQNILQIMIQVRLQMVIQVRLQIVIMVIQVRLQMVIMVIQVRLQMMIQVRLQMVTNLLLL